LAKVFDDGGQGTIDVHLSHGGGFSMQRWATRQGGFWDSQKWMAGDFTGDGKDDFTKVFNDGGQSTIDVHRL
jgi:serralysin